MKILRFEAENVKKIKVVEITPDGSLVMIGGKNAQGKSSILDSIMVALGGTKYADAKMVRDGKKKGFVEIDLGELKVRRTFTEAGGGVLTVTGADGLKVASPQALLDSLVGAISFDPLSFAKAKPREQGDIIKDLAGLDFTTINEKRQEAYDKRTEIGRELKRCESDLAGLQYNEDPVYADRVSVSELVKQMGEAEEHNGYMAELTGECERAWKTRVEMAEEAGRLRREVERLERSIEENDKRRGEIQDELGVLEEINIKEIREKISGAEEHNTIVSENESYIAAKKREEALQDEVKKLTGTIADWDQTRENMIREAEMPINNLGFDEDGTLLYQGLPFSQASDAEKVRVSVAIGLTMNPRLKVLLLKDGSLLDEDNLRMIAKMAQLSDAQLWVETVGSREGCSIIMEDGVAAALQN
jgi:DNA repair exonuclease SbcCD ATPase subunit